VKRLRENSAIRHLGPRDVCREAIAQAWNIDDASWCAIGQRLSERRHLEPQIALVHGEAGPSCFYQSAMTDDLSRMLDQMHKDIEGPAADSNRLTVSFQLSSCFYNTVLSK
jgi:hypothetical protein